LKTSPAKDQHETGNYIFNENIGKIFNEEDINAIESDFKKWDHFSIRKLSILV
jgi:hypothetical protein